MKQLNEPNRIFINNLNNLLNVGEEVPTQMKYSDGVEAKAITIGQVNESYIVDDLFDIYGYYTLPIQSFRDTPIISGLKEIEWIYLMSSNSLKDLEKLGILHWWEKFTLRRFDKLPESDKSKFENTIGKAYGYTVRNNNLLINLINNIINKPYSRDLILSLWQETDMNFQRAYGGLLPCVYSFRISLREDNNYNYLTLDLKQRSSDYLTAKTINISQYFGLVLHIINTINSNIINNNEVDDRFNHKLVRFHKINHNIDDLHIYDRHKPIAQSYVDNQDFVNNHPTLIKYIDNVDIPFHKRFNIIKPKTLNNPKLEFATF